MTQEFQETQKKQIGDLNQIHPTEDFKVFSLVKCPICNQTLQISLDLDLIDKKDYFPFPHVIVHGIPTHALIAYLDRELQVRAIEFSNSLQII